MDRDSEVESRSGSPEPPMTSRPPSIGIVLRGWRQRRQLSQLALALEAGISTRHLSCVENGRAAPSRAMVMRLAECLQVPLRERNSLLGIAGFASMYPERSLTNDPALQAARETVQLVLKAHEPNPALLVDRHWTLLAHNKALGRLLQDVSSDLLHPPLNVLRLSLDPQYGVASKIVNLPQWRAHLFARLHQQIRVTGDPVLSALLDDLQAFAPADERAHAEEDIPRLTEVAVPLQLRTPAGVLSFISTITVFGTPVDITLSELALETFFAADEATAQVLRQLSENVVHSEK
jgi:transcriptional regulator with XRE-family HTH domain